MDFRVAPSSREAVPLTPLGRRGHYRHQIQSLAYVNLDQTNGGVIRNLGDTGLAIQAVAPLYVNQQVFLRFDLANPRARIEANGPRGLGRSRGAGRGRVCASVPAFPAPAQRMDSGSAPDCGAKLGGGCGLLPQPQRPAGHGVVVLLGGAARNPPGTRSSRREAGAGAMAVSPAPCIPGFRSPFRHAHFRGWSMDWSCFRRCSCSR